jgi:hypothetical protein
MFYGHWRHVILKKKTLNLVCGLNFNNFQEKLHRVWIIFLQHFHHWDQHFLTPKIPWDQKLVDCCLGSLCEDFYFFFNFFFKTSELHISQAFCEHQTRLILISVWARGEFLLKIGIKLIFHVFFEGKFVLSIESLFFTFFFAHGFAWCYLQCDHCDLNAKFLIFFKKFYKVHSVEILSQDPRQQKGF